MAMAMTVENYLKTREIPYDVVPHIRTSMTSMRTAAVARIPPHEMAKAVLLKDGQGFVVAVVPADRHVSLRRLRRQLGRKVGLATEDEAMTLFRDCDLGALPPVGEAYGIETILDDELIEEPEVYFEAGNHQELIRMGREEFMRLHEHALRGHFCKH